jgi:poly-gamma-glutamate capsule biosynthesis protein CapA/YwtB (metallophosphatase superfamily)
MRRTSVLVALAAFSVACHGKSKHDLAPFSPPAPQAATEPSEEAAADPAPAPDAAPSDQTITLSAVGDCTLGDPFGSEKAKGSFHRAFDDGGKDMSKPFSGVVSTLQEDDLTIANLEGPLTTHGCRHDHAFAFRGRPEFAEMLSKGSVELVNLSNNHSTDCGPVGVTDTENALKSAKVGYFGLGHADVRTVKGIEVVNLGYTGGRLEVKSQVIADVTQYKKPGNLVIVTFHWGVEGSHAAGSVQASLGHAAIDAGADLVLGHHPHVLQGIEDYKGKRIVYSLGNFVFGGNARPSEWDSMIYRTRFAMKDGKVERVDDTIIPVEVSGDKKHNDFRPILLDGEQKATVVKEVEKLSSTLGHSAKTAERPHTAKTRKK